MLCRRLALEAWPNGDYFSEDAGGSALRIGAKTGAMTMSGETSTRGVQAESLYDLLRGIANGLLHGEGPGHTLQPTAIVHEAWVRLLKSRNLAGASKAEYLAAAANAMRRVLVDHARHKRRQKCGGHFMRIPLDASEVLAPRQVIDVLDLDEALTALAAESQRHARVVELRYFGGLTVEETAAALSVSPRTVELEWRAARAFLHRALA